MNSGFDVRDPNVVQPKTKDSSNLDHYFFFRENHIQQQKKNGLWEANSRGRLSSEAVYPVTKMDSFGLRTSAQAHWFFTISDDVRSLIWFCMPARYVLGAFGLGRHSGHYDAVFFCTKPRTRPLLRSFHFLTNLKRTLKNSVVRFSWIFFFALANQSKPRQASQHEKVGWRSGDWTRLMYSAPIGNRREIGCES